MRVEHGEVGVIGGGEDVIHQEPHAHPAVGGVKQAMGEDAAGGVGFDQEGGNVDAVLRAFDHAQAGTKGIGAVGEFEIGRLRAGLGGDCAAG